MSQQQQKRTEAEEARIKASFNKGVAIIAITALVLSIILTENGVTPFELTLPGTTFEVLGMHALAILFTFLWLNNIPIFLFMFYCQWRGRLPRDVENSRAPQPMANASNYQDNDIPSVNPATGKPLTHGGSGLDTGGNTYGSGS